MVWGLAIGKTEAEAQQYEKRGDFSFNGTPEKIADEMAKYIDIGVDYFMFWIKGLPNPDVANLITAELIPRINARS